MKLRIAFVLLAAANAWAQDGGISLADRLESAPEASRAALLAEESPENLKAALKLLRLRGLDFAKAYDHARALQSDRAGLPIAELLQDNPAKIALLQSIGLMLYRQGKNEEALETYRIGLKVAEQIGDRDDQARMWRGISNAQAVLAHIPEAQEAQLNAMHLFQELDNQKEVADCLLDLAVEYSHMGQNQLSAEYYKRGLEMARALKLPITIDRALQGLAALYTTQGDYAVALSYLEGVQHVPGSTLGDKRAEAYFDSKLGNLYMKLNKPEARDVLRRGLQTAREVKDLRLSAWFLEALAADTSETDRLRESLHDFDELAQIYGQLGDTDQHAWALSAAAHRHVLLNEPDQAVAKAEQAVSLLQRSVEPEYRAWTFLQLGRAYRAQGRREEAERALRTSIEVVESWRAQIAGGQLNGANFFDTLASCYKELMSMRGEDGASLEALQIAERLRARRLLDVIKQGKIDQDRPLSPEEKEREQALGREAAKWNASLAKASATTQDQAAFEKAARDLEAYRTELYTTHSRLRNRRGESELISEAGIQSLLPNAASLLVEYAFGEKETWVFTLARGEGKPTSRAIRIELKEKDLARRVEAFRKALATRDLSYRTLARELYRDLLGPIATELKGRTMVGIVPDGCLWNLPFQALLAEDGKYFIEHAAIYYAPSLTVLHETGSQRTSDSRLKPLLAVGASSGGLTNTVEEVGQLAKLYGPASVALTGSQATEKRWKEEAGRVRVLHVATHGILNSGNPLFSYLQLAKDPAGEEDGMLEAREFLDLNLRADLVVLSACETGRGEFIGGEGVLGMGWAVLTAGTPTVVVSQWKVDSASTTQLMVGFHRRIAPAAVRTGPIRGKAEALREAALDLLHAPGYQHPFYWAGFEMLGDGS